MVLQWWVSCWDLEMALATTWLVQMDDADPPALLDGMQQLHFMPAVESPQSPLP